MNESLSVQLPECNLVLLGAAERVNNELQKINSELMTTEDCEKTEAKRAKTQEEYDNALVNLATEWFDVRPEAVCRLTPERKKELEELVLQRAKEINKQGLFCGRVLSNLSQNTLMGLSFSVYFLLAVPGLIAGFVLGSPYIVVSLGLLLLPVALVPELLSQNSFSHKIATFYKVIDLLKAKDFLDNNEPKQIN